jgi:hypothetical protein
MKYAHDCSNKASSQYSLVTSTEFQYFTAADSLVELTLGAFVSASSVMDAE